MKRWASLLLLLPALSASAEVPTDFTPVIGHGLMCRDQVEPEYYYMYLFKHFGAPKRTWGQAYWFDTQDAELYGLTVKEVFISQQESAWAFLGAVIEEDVNETRDTLRKEVGETFKPFQEQGIYRSNNASFIFSYPVTGSDGVTTNGTKLYCHKYRRAYPKKPGPTPP